MVSPALCSALFQLDWSPLNISIFDFVGLSQLYRFKQVFLQFWIWLLFLRKLFLLFLLDKILKLNKVFFFRCKLIRMFGNRAWIIHVPRAELQLNWSLFFGDRSFWLSVYAAHALSFNGCHPQFVSCIFNQLKLLIFELAWISAVFLIWHRKRIFK